MKRAFVALAPAILLFASASAEAQPIRCDIPREARDIWRCENGFVIGPENVIIRLPIPETDPQTLYNAGLEAAGREDWRVAIAYFTAAHQLAPLVPTYMYNLGLAHARAGHEVAAIGWLSTYLIAEADSPNRTAIWAQIAELEASARRKADLLWDRALVAIAALPDTHLSTVPGGGYASGDTHMEGYARIAAWSMRAGEERRLAPALQAIERHSHVYPGAVANARQRAEEQWEHGGLSDSDAATMEARLGRQPPPSWATNSTVQEIRQGTLRFYLERSGWPLWYPQCHPDSAYLRRMREQQPAPREPMQLMDSGFPEANMPAPRMDEYFYYRRGSEVLDDLRRRPADLNSEMAACAGEMALLIGDTRQATAALRLAEEYERRERTSREWSGYRAGWAVTRLRALMMAEGGEIENAIAALDLFVSRRLTSSHFTHEDAFGNFQGAFSSFAPARSWQEARFYGVRNIAWHLISRGRLDEGFALAARLDPLRRLELLNEADRLIPPNLTQFRQRVAAERNATLAGAAPGGAMPDAQRLAWLTNAVIVTRTLGGAAYDLDWWLLHIQREPDAFRAMTELAAGAEDLLRGMRRARAAYARTGRAWGQ